MAQKILIRRGGIDNIGSTIGVSKGELIYASGSTSGVENVVFIANADGNNTFTPVNKLYSGTAAANSFNSALNGVPYYKSDSQALFILNSAGSTALDLSGNLEGTTISSIIATGSFSGSFTGNGSGLTNLSLSSITAPGNTTEVLFNNGGAVAATSNLKVTSTLLDATALNIATTGNISGSNLKLTGNADISGNVVIGGNITVGDATTDFINFGAEVSSSIIPDANLAFDLGNTTKYWRTVYAVNFSGSGGGTLSAAFATLDTLDVASYISASELRVNNNATVGSSLTVEGITQVDDLYVGSDPSLIHTFQIGATPKFVVKSDTGNTKIAGTLELTEAGVIAEKESAERTARWAKETEGEDEELVDENV